MVPVFARGSAPVNAAWTQLARQMLLRQRAGNAGWGYRPGGDAFVEPTVLAGLALLASDATAVDQDRPNYDLSTGPIHPPSPRPSPARGEGGYTGTEETAVREAAEWLAGIQTPNGSLPPCAGMSAPGWGTAHAILLWAALDAYEAERQRAAAWLLETAGETWPADETGVLEHDTSIPGWPWVGGTHPWLEPTAWAVLALRREGLADHIRVRDGIRMICDRAIPSGAWNFGSAAIFGANLHPQPAPTGLALMALAGSECDAGLIQRGCAYLRRTLPRIRAPRSLAWGLLGLRAWQQRVEHADAWLAESFSRLGDGHAGPMDLAQLLLAASAESLEVLGIGVLEGTSS
jgi:hypothetical protein